MIYVDARVRQFVLVVAVVLAGGLLLLLPKSINTGHAAHSPLPTLTVVCLPVLGGDLSVTDAGYVLDGNGGATLHLGLQNQDVVELTRISFRVTGWVPVAPAHGATVRGLLGDHLISLYAPAGRLAFTPLFNGYSLGATERFTFTVQGFTSSQPMQLTVRKGENMLETYIMDLNAPGCNHTPSPFSPLPTPTPTPVGFTLPTEPVAPTCVFTPPPGGIPDEPVIPLSAYSFSPPQVVVTSTAPLGIQQWLPDSKTLLISRESGVSQTVSVDLVNTATGVITEVVEPRLYLEMPLWLFWNRTVAWREFGLPEDELPNEAGYWLRSFGPIGEKRLSEDGRGGWNRTHDVSPNGKELVFMSLPGGTQPLIWNQEGKTLRALPVDLAAWRYEKGQAYPLLPFNVNWHPSGSKILFWDGTWVFLFDLPTNSGCEINMHELSQRYPFINEAAWSPNGRYLLLKIAQDPPYTSSQGSLDRAMILDTYTGETHDYEFTHAISNFSWAPDNQTVAMSGPTGRKIGSFDLHGTYLLNIYSGEYRQILPNAEHAVSRELWSPNGNRLAFQCHTFPDGVFQFNDYRICISHVSISW